MVAGIRIKATSDREWVDPFVLGLLIVGGLLLACGLLVLYPYATRAVGPKARRRRTRARELLAAAPIRYKGNDWGSVPLWTIDLVEPLNKTIDVHAFTEEEARRDKVVRQDIVRTLEEHDRPRQR
jgi:hypothetical protein